MGQIPGALHNLEAESHRRQETKKGKMSRERGQQNAHLVTWRLLVILQGQLVGTGTGLEGAEEEEDMRVQRAASTLRC